MSESHRVDVVMPAYNAARTVADAISSVLGQTAADLRLVVVDDGSHDSTRTIVEGLAASDPRVELLALDHGGVSRAHNRGLAVGSAPFVCFFDSDDLMLPDFLEAHLAAFDQHPEVGLVYGDAWVLDESVGRFKRAGAMSYRQPRRSLLEDQVRTLERLVERNFVFGEPVVRRVAVERVGGFESTLQTCEDYDLWLRLAASGVRFHRLEHRHAVWRDRPGSLSKDLPRMYEDWDRVCQRVVANEAVPEHVRAKARSVARGLPAELEVLQRRRSGALGKAWRLGRRVKRPLPWYWRSPRRLRLAFPDLARTRRASSP